MNKKPCKTILVALCAFALLYSEGKSSETNTIPHAQPNPPVAVAPCVAGMVVIVVGTVVIYKLWKLCKTYLPPINTSTNTTSTNSVIFSAGKFPGNQPADTNVYAAWFTTGVENISNVDSALCVVMPSGTTISTNGLVPWLGCPAVINNLVDWPTFLNELQSQYGLNPGDYYAEPGTVAFAENGQPVSSIPEISWDFAGGTGLYITNGSPTYTAVLERKDCLASTNWIPLLTNTVSVGMTVKIEDDDSPAASAFYRVMLETNTP